MVLRIEKRPFLCSIGLHRSWYVDGALIYFVERCGRCNQPRDEDRAMKLEIERGLWEEYEDDPNPEQRVMGEINHRIAEAIRAKI